MKILALDSSGGVASAALVTEEVLTAEITVNNKLTHSQTLMPMIERAFEYAGWEREDIDYIAVSAGPGSFTGLRIGSGTVKGLAMALDRPVIQVSSLEAMAYGAVGCEGQICPMMDARRRQVYTGIYSFSDGFKTLADPAALSIEEAAENINRLQMPVLLMGDGVPVYIEALKGLLSVPYQEAPPHLNRQRASSVGALAIGYALRGETVSAAEHVPVYLRLSQAERERLGRSEG